MFSKMCALESIIHAFIHRIYWTRSKTMRMCCFGLVFMNKMARVQVVSKCFSHITWEEDTLSSSSLHAEFMLQRYSAIAFHNRAILNTGLNIMMCGTKKLRVNGEIMDHWLVRIWDHCIAPQLDSLLHC